MADKVIDVTKFQNFWITLILVGAYVVLAVATISSLSDIGQLMSLPGLSANLVSLLAISHAGYLAGKIPSPAGEPPTASVATLIGQ
jgi:hypothetical protein